jgi:hypothetical protein
MSEYDKAVDSGGFDVILAEVAGRCGGIEPFFDALFGFLHRKTDFYVEYDEARADGAVKAPTMGFPRGKAEQLLLKSFRKHKMKPYSTMQPSSTGNYTQQAPTLREAAVSSLPSHGHVVGPRECQGLATAGANSSGQLQVPVGNGGIGPNYAWTQLLKELTVIVDVPSCCRSRDIRCEIKRKSLSVQVLKNVMIDGEFEDAVNASESIWTLNSSDGTSCSAQIVINLDKARPLWWKHVLVGHPEIDTTKVICANHAQFFGRWHLSM